MTWYVRDPRRLALEERAMVQNTNAVLRKEGPALAWFEETVSKATGQRYVIKVAYPERFPHEPPKAFVLYPDVAGAPHRLGDQSLCLFDNPFAAVGVKTTALLVRTRAVVWILAYEVWRATGNWMAPQHRPLCRGTPP